MTQTPDLMIGRVIDGYRVERLLGRGGMARVYRALDENLHRHVALKVIDPRSGANLLDYQERFKREARAIAQLKHGNIVGVYRFGEVDSVYYMAMDYIDGVDLGWVLEDYDKDKTLMPHDEVYRVVRKIASALDYAHTQGVIHRDVKPSNIMINQREEPVLTDFGLVMMATEETEGDIFGSPYYIAPEQAVNSAGVVAQSDLYSLGVMIYQMLTGVTPYDDGTPMQVAMAHMTKPIPDPQQHNPRLHKAFTPFLKKALAKEPEGRYESGRELTNALRDTMQKAGTDTSSPTTRSKRNQPEADYLKDKLAKHQALNPPSQVIYTAETALVEHTRFQDRARRFLLMLIAALVFALAIAGAYITYDVLNDDPVSAPANVERAVEVVSIQGPLQALDDTTLTLFEMDVVLPELPDALSEVGIGDIVRVEGEYTQRGDTITITQLTNAEIDPPLFPDEE